MKNLFALALFAFADHASEIEHVTISHEPKS